MPDARLARMLGLASAANWVAAALLGFSDCSRPLRAEPEAQPQPSLAPAPGAGDSGARLEPAVTGSTGATSRAATPAHGTGVAVVELFTSEGCSSCPPADRVLARLASRAAGDSLPIYPLSFHVDYWNHLGWADRFSSSSYSDRQRAYAAINPSGGIYTPQVVVNGNAECVGSDAPQLDSLIAAALGRAPRTRVELEAQRADGAIVVSYRVNGDTAGRVLNLALLEPRVESAVKSGENAGERLAHVNVVRAFTTRALASGNAGSWSSRPSADFAARPVAVVAYVEAATQRDISGAAALELD